jgi:nucleotide-binding universal stress UspA family protein
MKIICGIDFSEGSVHASRIAVRLARRLGDEILLVHAFSSPFLLYRELIGDPLTVEAKVRAESALKLEAVASSLRDGGAKVETRLVEDADPARAIAALAKDDGARLVVVGTRGRGTLAHLFLGSVAERTVLLSDRPVLIAHAGGGALEEWADGKRPLRLAVGVDLSPASVAAVGWVRALRTLGPVDVTFIHAFWPFEQYARIGVHGAPDLLAANEEMTKVLTRDLRPLLSDLPGEGKTALQLKPVWGSAALPIVEEAQKVSADLLVLGTNHKSALERLWVGSTVQPTLRAATMPVVCVPGGDEAPAGAPSIARIGHILAPTDLSERANHALPYAFALARPGSTVTLCYVHERPLPTPAYAYEDNRHALSPVQRAEIETKLRALVPRDAGREQIAVKVSIAEGSDPATAIVQEATRLGADVICMATHGRSGLGQALLGSVATAVERHARQPVLLVR